MALRSVLLPWLLAASTVAAGTTVDEVIRAEIEEMRLAADRLVAGERVTGGELLMTLYEQGTFQPLWSRSERRQALLRSILGAEADGLDRRDYHWQALEHLEASPAPPLAGDARTVGQQDILLTDALLRLITHLRLGKVDPVSLDPAWNLPRGDDPLPADQTAAALLVAGDLETAIDALRPTLPYYRDLKTALARYRGLAAAGGWPLLPEGPTLRLGDRGQRVLALRARLAVTDPMVGEPVDPALFDAELDSAVHRFQRRHGLEVDGAVGRGTRAALNVPVAERIEQLRINLERARWVLQDLDPEFVLVDIAGFSVLYVRDAEVLWRSRAVVGRSYRKTPIFRGEMRYLVLNPTWTIPPTIVAEDVLPAVKRDPSYLAARNIRVLDANGRALNPATVDWARYSGRDFPYLLRQEPGPDNALGRIKFMFPNRYHVYLHDTPSREPFGRAGRAFSSGCIRVERPLELAELVLGDPRRWSATLLAAFIAQGKTRTIHLPRPLPVLLLYWTATVGEDGEISFRPDIYDRDPPLRAALNATFEEW